MLITADIRAKAFHKRVIAGEYPLEFDSKLDIFVFGFLALHIHNFFYCVPDVEHREILPELASFDLRVV